MEDDDDTIKRRLMEAHDEDNNKLPKSKRKPFEWTENKREQFLRCQEARNRNIEKRKLSKQVELIPPVPSPLPPLPDIPTKNEDSSEEIVVVKKKKKKVERVYSSSEDSDEISYRQYERNLIRYKNAKKKSEEKKRKEYKEIITQMARNNINYSETESDEEENLPTTLPKRKKPVTWNNPPSAPRLFFA